VEKLDALLKKALLEEAAAATLLYDFVAPDGVRHEFWRLDDQDMAEQIRSCFAAIPTLYIADGHHRAAAAARVADLSLEENSTVRAEAERFLVAVFGSKELRVFDFNRVVSELTGHTPAELLEAIKEVVEVEPQGAEPYRPAKRGEMGMYLDGQWYKLSILPSSRPDDLVEGLDVALLHSLILSPILHIEDPRSDPRISYVGGPRGLTELAEKAAKTGGAAFALYPCSIEELFAVADENRLMPPKSTWFDPKPKSGLAIHRIKQ
jgi:uncharacterized protein (DUF1015 family)